MRIVDALATRYHVDPWTVLEWPPERTAIAALCLAAAAEERAERVRRAGADGGMIFPVLDILAGV